MAHISSKRRSLRYAGIYRSIPFIAAAALALVSYLSLANLKTSNLSDAQAFAIQLSIIAPIALIWIIAMRGALHLKLYAESIRSSPDGKGIAAIANGLLVLVVYVILLPLLRSIVVMLHDTRWFNTAVIINNFIPIAMLAVCVAFLFKGSKQLLKVVKSTPWTPLRVRLLTIGFGLFASLFVAYFCLIVPDITGDNGVPRFILPVTLLAFIYTIPQLLIWLFGLVSCFNIAHYAMRTPGRIYRIMFMRLKTGLLTVIGCIFVTQLLVMSPMDLTGVTPGTLFIYALLIIVALGFVDIERGATGLHKIEEVD